MDRQYHTKFAVRVASSSDMFRIIKQVKYGLLNRLNKQEVCVINVRNSVNVAYVFVWKQLSPEARQAITNVQDKCLTVSTTDCRPNVHGTEDLLR